MNKILKGIWDEARGSFLDGIEEQRAYFDKPLSLKLTLEGVIAALSASFDEAVNELIARKLISSPSEAMSFVKKNEEFLAVSKQANRLNDAETVSALSGSCLIDASTNDDYSGPMQVSYEDVTSSSSGEELKSYIGALCSLAFVCIETVKMLSRTEFPSKYRAKYLQHICKICKHDAKKYSSREISRFKSIINSIDVVDAMIASTVSLAYTYLSNRYSMWQSSANETNEAMSTVTCDSSIALPFDLDPSVRVLSNIDISDIGCPLNDDEVSPSSRIMDEARVDCNIAPIITEPEYFADTVEPTDAVFRFVREEQFLPYVTVGMQLNSAVRIGVVDSSTVMSPVSGEVSTIAGTDVYVVDVELINDEIIENLTEELANNHATLGDTREAIKSYFVKLSYPLMLKNPGRSIGTGLRAEYDGILSSYRSSLKDYERKIQDVAKPGSFNENDDLDAFSSGITSLTDALLDSVKITISNSQNSLHNVNPVPSDYVLFSYYVSLLGEINSSPNITETLRSLRDKVKEFAENRLYVEKPAVDVVKGMINARLNDFVGGRSIDYFAAMTSRYEVKKKISDVSDYVSSSLAPVSGKTSTERDEALSYAMTVFEFWTSRNVVLSKYKDVVMTSNQLLDAEYSYVKTFVDSSFSRMDTLNARNVAITEELRSRAALASPAVSTINGKKVYVFDYRPKSTCTVSHDPDINPDAKDDMTTRRYWLKYFAVVTALSVASVDRWSTGLILPTGPVLFPVVYVPIVPIKTSFGVIVIGLSVCGVSVSPFVYKVNGSGNYASVISVASPIKAEIKALKKEIKSLPETIKESIVKPAIAESLSEIKELRSSIRANDAKMKTSRENKPASKSGADYAKWKVNDDALKAKAKALNAEKAMKEKKHKSLSDYDKLGKVPGNDDQTSLKVKAAVKSIDAKKKKLDDLIDKVDSIISKIPGAIPPNSTVFGPTAKKPGKNNTIDDDITDSVNKGALSTSVSSFKKSNEIFMKKNFSRGKKLSEYRRELKLGLNSILKKEPFPTYSKIRMTNPGFIAYCRKVILTGSRSFGIPGQLPQ
jgi:hypothetical protein